jgi:DNA processing protein
MDKQMKYWVWLSSIPKVGAIKRKQLLEHFKDPEKVWEASEIELARLPFMTRESIKNIFDKRYREEVDKYLESIEKHHINIITINDDKYPYYLKNIYDPPIALYVKGDFIKQEKNVAVVGSRNATSYGLDIAENIAFELSMRGITVVSGMARGVDTFAHKGALRAGGRTLAILGCGPDIVYPSENKKIADSIQKNGAIISEYLPGVQPLPGYFPARNRIISGLSYGVIIVEAGERSGSLITANLALEQGREVFAVPGNIGSRNSKGTNKLIKEGAKLVTTVDDIFEELNFFDEMNNEYNNNTNITKVKSFVGLDPEEMKMVECLQNEELHIDALAKQSGLSIQIVNSIMTLMELKGIVNQLPGKKFRLKD